MKDQRGFTLLELMIVVALIMIIAAIAVPSLTGSKISANEASAVASVRAINTAEVAYQSVYAGFANSLANLGGAEPCTKSAETACLLDQSLAGGEKGGIPLCRDRRKSQRRPEYELCRRCRPGRLRPHRAPLVLLIGQRRNSCRSERGRQHHPAER